MRTSWWRSLIWSQKNVTCRPESPGSDRDHPYSQSGPSGRPLCVQHEPEIDDSQHDYPDPISEPTTGGTSRGGSTAGCPGHADDRDDGWAPIPMMKESTSIQLAALEAGAGDFMASVSARPEPPLGRVGRFLEVRPIGGFLHGFGCGSLGHRGDPGSFSTRVHAEARSRAIG